MSHEGKDADLTSLSVEELFARYDEARHREAESFVPETGSPERGSRFFLNEKGRLIPDLAAKGERGRFYEEIRRRATLHDPEVLGRASEILLKDFPKTKREVRRFWLESATGSDGARSEAVESETRVYAKWTTKALLNQLEKLEGKIRALDERIPNWRMLQGGLGNEPSPAYIEGRRWESDREKITLELLNRGAFSVPAESVQASNVPAPAAGESHAQNSAPSAESVESESRNAAPSNAREAFIRPILEKKGFSVHKWATVAKVDFHTADNYLKGKAKPYPDTLKSLADALGVEVAKLPE
jgi:lambda repressor-like predicted transcriptional regulator